MAAAAPRSTTLGNLAENGPATDSKPPEFGRKVKLGVIGTGGAAPGSPNSFKSTAATNCMLSADYFQEVADRRGDELGVERAGASQPCRVTDE